MSLKIVHEDSRTYSTVKNSDLECDKVIFVLTELPDMFQPKKFDLIWTIEVACWFHCWKQEALTVTYI